MWESLKQLISETQKRRDKYRHALEIIASGRNEQGLYATKQILQNVARRALDGAN